MSDKHYIPAFIYVSGEPDEDPKRVLIEVSPELYRSYYRPVWKSRNEARRNGECLTEDWHKCDGDCGTCKYHTTGRKVESLDELLDQISDDEQESLTSEYDDVAEQVTEAILQEQRLRAIESMDVESQLICRMIAAGLPEREAGQVLGISKTAYHKRKIKLLEQLQEDWAELQ